MIYQTDLDKTKQKGAALIVSLIILTVMTLLGVTAMSQSGLEALMAGNFQTQTNAMSAAENQLNQAEQALADSDSTPFIFNEYDEDINPAEQLTTAALNADGDFRDFYIEYLGPRTISGESVVIGRETPRAGAEIYLFRNTALHSNNDNGSRRIVQSIYATEQAPTAP
ncbi:MAG: hypothetical protein GXP21_01085 [Gammaproteobacteria bacterium]|nr:hypothetical protein [Gammaproteobacteria bacterium]